MKKLIFSLFFVLSSLILMAQPKVVAHRGFWDTDNSAQNSITSLYKACEAELKKLGFSGVDYHYSVYQNNPDWIKQAQEYGLEVNVWTVNDPELMKKMAEMGVDYITTDKPLLCPKQP